MATMDAVEVGEGGSGRFPLCYSTPSERGDFSSAATGSGYSRSLDISILQTRNRQEQVDFSTAVRRQ